ncbi:LIM domain only protein 3-like isoform X2 [Orbicella faveolata]|uniref:LIM domain only protein 3-like isoform X2 n=1 Tax=Orbicella faveolata TaxID=48498 RepID=UPI0009E3310A|nr:LIM domain only protein 3-like isoform X2 [Orbicella faveolata]
MNMGDNDNDDKQIGEEKPKELKICAQCGEKIEGKFLLRALDQFWHEECLKCSYCSTQLADLSSKFYHKGDLILCKRDYIRLFGATGICSHCSKTIPPLEMVMQAREHIYHSDCFAGQVCQYRFSVGDKFFLHFHVVLYEADYYDVTSIFQQIPYYM